MNVPSWVYRQLSIVAWEFDDINNLGHNYLIGFIALLKCPHIMEDKSCRGYSFSREVNLLLKYDNYALKLFNLFSILELQGKKVRLKITIYTSKMRVHTCILLDRIFPSGHFMSMGVDNLVSLRYH